MLSAERGLRWAPSQLAHIPSARNASGYGGVVSDLHVLEIEQLSHNHQLTGIAPSASES